MLKRNKPIQHTFAFIIHIVRDRGELGGRGLQPNSFDRNFPVLRTLRHVKYRNHPQDEDYRIKLHKHQFNRIIEKRLQTDRNKQCYFHNIRAVFVASYKSMTYEE